MNKLIIYFLLICELEQKLKIKLLLLAYHK